MRFFKITKLFNGRPIDEIDEALFGKGLATHWMRLPDAPELLSQGTKMNETFIKTADDTFVNKDSITRMWIETQHNNGEHIEGTKVYQILAKTKDNEYIIDRCDSMEEARNKLFYLCGYLCGTEEHGL